MNHGQSRPHGMPCPQCGQSIVVDAMQLLAGTPIECVACGLELRVNQQRSADTLAALQAYMDDLSKAKSQYSQQVDEMLTDDSSSSRRGRTRRSGENNRRARRRPS